MIRLLMGALGAVLYRRLGHDIDSEIVDLPSPDETTRTVPRLVHTPETCEGCAETVAGMPNDRPWHVVGIPSNSDELGTWGITNRFGSILAHIDDQRTAEAVVAVANK